MADELQKLATEWRGELRAKNLAGRVLADFNIIKGLRSQKCPWHRIAGAMGVNPDSLRKLYLWTEAAIQAKRLEPPPPDHPPTTTSRRTAATTTTTAPPLPGQRQVAGEMSELDRIRAEFDK